MITITFNGAINSDNIDLYRDIFNGETVNPNGCTIKGTFYVSHRYTNYSAVQELHRRGHEIGVFSVTNKDDPDYWSEGSYDDWLAEMAGARLIIERFANISDGTITGVRVRIYIFSFKYFFQKSFRYFFQKFQSFFSKTFFRPPSSGWAATPSSR